MTQVPPAQAPVCYRHPDRVSYIRCQRCNRPICPDCQTQAPVGFICPDDMAQMRQTAPRTKPPIVARIKGMTRQGQPVVTYGIIALCVLVFVTEFIPPLNTIQTLQYAPAYSYSDLPGVGFEPWRMLTSVFVHSPSLSFGILPVHILLNMYTLWIFGLALEQLLGRSRYLALYLISGFSGSLGVLIIMPLVDPIYGLGTAVVGASGAIFGLMGAFFVIQRHLGGNARQLLVLVVINFAIGFVIPGIAWEAHLGGLVGGALVGLIYTKTRMRSQRRLQLGLLTALSVALIGLSVAVPALF